MMARCIDRIIFGLELQHAAESDDANHALEALVRQVLVGDEVELCEDDATAVITAAQSIDAVMPDPEHMRGLARELGYVLVKQPSNRALEFICLVLDSVNRPEFAGDSNA